MNETEAAGDKGSTIPGDPDRVVVVTAGFGLWRGTHHVMSTPWRNVVRIRGYAIGSIEAEAFRVVVELENGSQIELRAETPGWKAWVDRAHAMFPGMPPAATWIADATRPELAGGQIVLFERAAAKRRPK